MATAVLTSLIKRILSLVPQTSSSSREPPSSAELQLHDLANTMKSIHAVLEDAEEKDIIDKSEQLRLRELKEVAYDAEDAIDEYEYQVLRAKMEARRKVMSCRMNDSDWNSYHPKWKLEGRPKWKLDEVIFDWNSYHPRIYVSNELISRVKEIRERFKETTDEWNRISLREKDGKRRRVKKWKPIETTSYFDENKTFGRQDEKDNIIKWLLERPNETNEGGVSVLPIVGMGGLGKTTLAQMVYHDPRVHQHFDMKAWVCVSQEFNVDNLLAKICNSFSTATNSYMSLNKFPKALNRKLKGKECFLVLDDVWNQNFELWNSLRSLLVDVGVGKILVTTRNESVAKITQTTDPIKLQILSFENCWSLFTKICFEARNYELEHNFMDMGKKMVEKCQGLPLAVKVLAGFLSIEDDEEAWIEILDSKLWEIDDENDGVWSALKLSYDNMPIELRRCFMYLCLFPKDSPLKQATVVQQWMANGFLHPKGNKREEDIGNDYFNELLRRSILQYYNDNRKRFVMHDLIHDFAQDLAKAECLLVSTEKLHEHTIPKTIRHLSIFVKENFKIKDLVPIFETKLRLRTLMFHSVRDFPISNLMLYLMHNLRNLRTLSFRIHQFRRQKVTLDFIDTLKHLRYLGSNMHIVDVPESVYNLYYLQTLDLRSSFDLSGRISDLVNLRNFTGHSPNGMPEELRVLTHLRKLRHFVVGAETWKCKLRHLKDFVNLRGKLSVGGLETVGPSDFTPSECYLKTMRGIVELALCWYTDSNNTVDCDEKLAEQVMESLQPHPNIKSLRIHHYPGAILPSWLGSLCKLEFLFLKCPKITSLLILCQLPRLKCLHIAGMERVKTVGRELLCSSSPAVDTTTAEDAKKSCFPSLEVLYFFGNPEWEEWHGVVDSDFPRLRRLCFQDCPKLRRFPHLSDVECLVIISCPELRLPSLPSVTRLELVIEWNPEVLLSDSLPMLRDLDMSELKDDSFVFPDSQIVRTIEKLSIRYCRELKCIAGLGNLASLQHLKIYKCHHLQISPDERLPPNVQDVQIHQSPFAKSWYQHQIWDGSGDLQMDPESELEDDDYGYEGMSMNSESEQDMDDSVIEADISSLNI